MRVCGWVCATVVFLLLGEYTSSKKIPRWWMKVAQRQGPNACVVEEIPNTDLEFWTECRYWLNRKICGRRTRIRFECCEGFERMNGDDGCTRVKPLMNLLETAESLGATKWAQYIRESGLAGELQSAGAYTLFAPTNEAFENLRRSLRSQMETYRGNPNNPILLYHIVATKLLSEEFKANKMVETRHQGHSLRVNKYSNGMTTINCALLIRKDQHATNGVVHLISNILDPSVGISQNVADMVLNDGRFSVLANILEKSGYINVLRTMQNSITILAPSDEAFQKLPESRREKIINDREARLALLQNHVIPHVICESAITGEHRVRTVSDNKLTFNCDVDGAYVERTKLRGNFNLGKNGIIHMIDNVLLPDRAKNLIELAESRQLFTFVELVRKAGLEETLSHTGDYTFFVPDEAAWYAVDSEVISEARRDLELAGQLVRFHGAYGRHLTNAITDNQAIMSLNEENPVRLQVWRRALGVEDAKITEKDIEAQNGVIHIINKVIVPSNQSVEDILRSIPGQSFENFLDAMLMVTSQENSVLNLGPGDQSFYTFFVPTDHAFRSLDGETLSAIRTNVEYTKELVKSHVAVNMFPSTSFEKNLIYTVNGMAGPFDVKKTRDNILKVNGQEVMSSHMSAHGVIHVIDKVFLPEYTYTSVSRVRTSYAGDQGGRGRSTSRSPTSRRTYKKTVTFAETYDGGEPNQLPAFPQGPEGDGGTPHGYSSTSTRSYSYNFTSGGRGGGGLGGDVLLHPSNGGQNLPPPPAGFDLGTYTFSNTSHRRNTVGPSNPAGGKFSYVGHSYGQDVVGHIDPVVSRVGSGDAGSPPPPPPPPPLPYIRGGVGGRGSSTGSDTPPPPPRPLPYVRAGGGGVRSSSSDDASPPPSPFSRRSESHRSLSSGEGVGGRRTYYTHSTHVEGGRSGGGSPPPPLAGGGDATTPDVRGRALGGGGSSSISRSGGTTTSTSRRYGVTRTVVTSSSSSKPFSRSGQPHPFPTEGEPNALLSSRDGKGDTSSISAYALTGDEDRLYADGADFAESKAGGETSLTRKEAAALRRRWRRRRHHKRGGKKRRNRKGGKHRTTAGRE